MSVVQPEVRNSRLRKLTGVKIVETGSFVPDNLITNEDLAALGCDAEWIVQRTGIQERRHATPGMSTSTMAIEAARRCVERSGVNPADIDLVLLGTMSPDYLLPASACLVQDALGLTCPATDISAACAGFLYSLITGMQFVGTGCSELALIIGADCNSRVMNPEDKKTFPLFGDGAGAVLLARGDDNQGMPAYTLGSDGSGADLLCRKMGGSRIPFDEDDTQGKAYLVHMDGRPVFKWAIRLLADTCNAVLAKAGLTHDDIDLWVMHQANVRIINSAVDHMGIPHDRVMLNIDRYGNTSAASVPIVLDEAHREGRIKRGDRIMMCGFGAGLCWGTAIFQW